MNTQTEQITDSWVELTDAERTNLESAVRFRIRATSSYSELLKAALPFVVSLYGKHSDRVAVSEREYMLEPEDLLRVHSHVMHANSSRCQTLRRLADAVISESGLRPYMREPGKFRGENYGVNWYKLPESWRKA